MLSLAILAASAALVLPAFEVSVEPENRNFDTRVTITNVSDDVQRARINFWTDAGHPVLYYTTKLEARASKTISLRDVIVDGTVDICASPGARVPDALKHTVRCQLTIGCPAGLHDSNADCRPVGSRHAHAIGYVTIDSVSDCMDLTSPNDQAYAAQIRHEAVLKGTFEQLANGKVVLAGALIDRAAGPVPAFTPPTLPHDPLAKAPPQQCPPLPDVAVP
jgi:hypothetical protein